LHEVLAEEFPAARSRKVAAGVKVSLLVSAVADGPKSISIYGERTSEINTLRIGPWIKDRILLIDLGFYKHHMFTKIKENGGFFVSRLKATANPIIISSNRTCRGNSIDVVGKTVKEVLPKLKRQVLDLTVEVPIKRRGYNGKQRGDTSQFRLVAVYNEEAKKYHVYMTNIDCDTLGPEDIASLYGARWEIELIFKELKSRYAMDLVKTKNPQIIEAYIWTAILTLLVSKKIHSMIRAEGKRNGKEAARYTQLRWSTIFSEQASDLLSSVLKYQDIRLDIMTFNDVYNSEALDPHVGRERFREEWWT
jgi:putative transposase